jgi:hypothetical protein
MGNGFDGLADELTGLVQRHVGEVRTSLEDELERLRTELGERARDAGEGAAYIGGAAALALVAAAALASLPLIALRKAIPPAPLALLVAGAGAAGCSVLLRKGFARLRTAAPAAVEEKLDEAAREMTDALKSRAASAADHLTG